MQISNLLKKAIEIAAKFARSIGLENLETEHLFFGILLEKNAKSVNIFNNLGVNSDNLKKFLLLNIKQDRIKISNSISYSKELSDLISSSAKLCEYNNKREIYIDELVYTMVSNTSFRATKIIKDYYKLNLENLKNNLELLLGISKQSIENVNNTNSLVNSTLPECLTNLGYDLTKKIKESNFQKIIGRDIETEKVIEILCRKTKNNPILIGEPGVGKSSIIEGLAQRIINGNVPEILANKIIFALDIASLISGTKFRGTMEQKLKDAISTIQENKNILVFIDEIHTLVQAGGKEGEISPADILKPYLARGELHCIGATTTKEYKDYIEKDAALERRFQPVKVEEPSQEDTIRILKGIRYSFEEFHNVKILDEAIESAVTLSSRYITNRFLPDKAIDLIDEACSKIKVNALMIPDEVKVLSKKINDLEKLKEECWKNEAFLEADKCKKTINDLKEKIANIRQKQSNNGSNMWEINDSIIRDVISSWTNIPLQKITVSEKEKLLNLENIIKNRVIGQDEAVSEICKSIRRSRAGISDPNRPIGSFLFLGPTGVGKTELTKALGDVLFDDENAIVRFDMSEFRDAHSISRLIGAPPGYVGHDDGGELTEAVRKNPYTIVLFDEIEKAHSDIFNILLQIFDDGRLTDSSGKLVNFKNTIIILTSNNGVQDLLARRRFEREYPNQIRVNSQEFLMTKLRDNFKPELINRIDSIVIFDSLSKTDILKITDIMLNNLKKRLSRKNILLDITDKAKLLICNKGYDEEYGARPLRRVIDKEINDVIAEMIIIGKVGDNSAIKIDEVNGKFYFQILC